MSKAYYSNIEYSRALQEKYEYYFIALNFTLLALSVQTADFTSYSAQVVIELFGWLLLLSAGLLGLTRLEMQPVGHKGYAELQRKEEKLKQMKSGPHHTMCRQKRSMSKRKISVLIFMLWVRVYFML